MVVGGGGWLRIVEVSCAKGVPSRRSLCILLYTTKREGFVPKRVLVPLRVNTGELPWWGKLPRLLQYSPALAPVRVFRPFLLSCA